MPANRTFSLNYKVTDAEAFLRAAAERLVEQNAFETVEDARHDLRDDLDMAARVLLDPGELPGAEIFDSGASIDQPFAK